MIQRRVGAYGARICHNVKWGVRYGCYFAFAFTVIVTIQWVLGGALNVREAHVSYGSVVGVYFIAGIGGGTILGILRSWSHTRLGAIAIGLLIAALTAWAGMTAYEGLHWDRAGYVVSSILALFWGISGGLGLYRVFTPPDKRRWY